MLVPDFTEGFGILVKHSLHYNEQHNRCDARFGIVVAKEFFDQDGGVVCFPVVHWEGQAGPAMCHPANVTPINVELPMVEAE